MSIQRATHNQQHPYFQIVRGVAQNKAISYEALGMLAYLLSKPDDWKIVPDDLKRAGCGRDKVYKLLKELETAGHIIQKRQEAAQGVPPMWGERTVVEQPYPETPDTEIQETVELCPEMPDTVKAGYGETDTTYTDKYINTEQETRTRESTPVPYHVDRQFNDPAAYMKGYALINAYVQCFPEKQRPVGLHRQRTIYTLAAELFDAGYTPQDVDRVVRAKLSEGKQDYRFMFLSTDLPKSRATVVSPLGDPNDKSSVAYAWANAK